MKNEKDIFDFIKPVKLEEPTAEYFSGLADEIIADNKTKIIPIYKKPVFWLSSAAACIIVLFIILNFNQTTEIQTSQLLAFNEIDNSEIIQYIDENIDDFDTDLIIEVIQESNLSEDEKAPIIIKEIVQPTETTITFDEISKDDILNYLNSEEIDIIDLEEDLFI